MISILGIGVTDNQVLLGGIKRVLENSGRQSNRTRPYPFPGFMTRTMWEPAIPRLYFCWCWVFSESCQIHPDFLADSAQKALQWIAYQSPVDRYLVAQQPTSDWRDEQWVMGYGLYVNTLVYSCLKIFGYHQQAGRLLNEMKQFTITGDVIHRHVHEGLVVPDKPYYALWSYKLYSSERFDLLGNSLAILSGIASPERAGAMIDWIEAECLALKKSGQLVPGSAS